ncbi:MAG: pilus assembly protein [bacterium]|nr:pilus assembly protein [bacterium]
MNRLRRLLAEDHAEEGSAIVEFIVLTFVLLVPLVYLILTFFQLQGAAFAAEGAARDAGRLLAASRDEVAGRDSAELATRISFDDAGFPGPVSLHLECSGSPCLSSGSAIRATVTTEVALPLIPLGIVDALGARVPVSGTAVTIVDEWVNR